MKILITGAGGLLGQEVWACLSESHELIAVGRTHPIHVPIKQWHKIDLTDEEQLYPLVTRENPELIIHTAALSDVDGAEKNPDEAYRHNSLACRNLALACQRFDATLMSVSTDYVFDGENPPASGYREFDACHPLSRYGESKYWGELFVSQLLNKFFIVRTSWLFGPGRTTWVDKVAQAVRGDDEIIAVQDMVSAPTYAPDLAQAMAELTASRHYGIYHLTNTGFSSRVELAQDVARLCGHARHPRLKIVTQAQLQLPARRPRRSGLDNLAWRLDGHQPLRSWQKALAAHFEKASIMK